MRPPFATTTWRFSPRSPWSRNFGYRQLCSFSVGFFLESHIEVGGLPEHKQERPEREPPRSIGFKPEIDAQPIDASRLHRRRSVREVLSD